MSRHHAPSARVHLPAFSMVIQALAGFFHQPNKDGFHAAPTQIASQPQKLDGLALLNQRALLIHRARQAKPRSEARAKLIGQAYSLTHDILRRGPDAPRREG